MMRLDCCPKPLIAKKHSVAEKKIFLIFSKFSLQKALQNIDFQTLASLLTRPIFKLLHTCVPCAALVGVGFAITAADWFVNIGAILLLRVSVNAFVVTFTVSPRFQASTFSHAGVGVSFSIATANWPVLLCTALVTDFGWVNAIIATTFFPSPNASFFCLARVVVVLSVTATNRAVIPRTTLAGVNL